MFELEGKNVVVLGLAKSGTTIAKILHRMKAKIVVNDAKSEEKCPEKETLERLGIKVICGTHPENLVNEEVDLVVKNPGIPYTIRPIICKCIGKLSYCITVIIVCVITGVKTN